MSLFAIISHLKLSECNNQCKFRIGVLLGNLKNAREMANKSRIASEEYLKKIFVQIGER